MKNFHLFMKAFGVVVSGLAGGAAVYLMLPSQVPEAYRWIAGITISTFISAGYAYNEVGESKVTRRLILRLTTIVGAAIACYAGLSLFEDMEYLKQLDMKSYQAIVETTEENAKQHVLKSQRESAQQYRAAVKENLVSSPAKFFFWLSDETGLSVALLMVISAALVGLGIDTANTSVFRFGMPRKETFWERISPPLRNAAGWLGEVFSNFFEWIAKWLGKLGQLVEMFLEMFVVLFAMAINLMRKKGNVPGNNSNCSQKRPKAVTGNGKNDETGTTGNVKKNAKKLDVPDLDPRSPIYQKIAELLREQWVPGNMSLQNIADHKEVRRSKTTVHKIKEMEKIKR